MNITHAVIPAAGLGTRLLPFTKAIPKEMIPLGNHPAIEFIIRECVTSDIQKVHCVINDTKYALKEYLSRHTPIEEQLQKSGKAHLLHELNALLDAVTISFITQSHPRGLGDAILTAQPAVADAPYFGVLLPDDLIFGATPALRRLIAVAQEHQGMVLAVQEVPLSMTHCYGIVAPEKQISDNLFSVSRLVEKPAPHHAPSCFAIIGRYILSSALFPQLEQMRATHVSGELQLTDAIDALVQKGHPVYAQVITDTRYDIGTPRGWLAAVMGYAQQNDL